MMANSNLAQGGSECEPHKYIPLHPNKICLQVNIPPDPYNFSTHPQCEGK